jgi:hypothetical protein
MRAKYLIIPVALAALAGCNDMLTETPRAQVVTETFFKSAADARAAIIAAYQPLNSGNLYGTNMQWATIAGSDEGFVGKDEENINIINLTRDNWDPTNGYVTGPWNGYYSIITRSNLILDKVPAIEMDETQKAQILAEAKFLRAFSYFNLIRLYGDVPLVTTPEEQQALGPRTPKADVWTQVIKDVNEAEPVLPTSWDSGNKGRATKGAADALLADVYVWRSSAEGSNEWQQASDAAKKVIDSGVYALVPNYIDAFLPGSQNRSEEIFAVQATGAAGGTTVSIATWTWPREMGAGSPGGWGTYVPTTPVLDLYPAGDYRREVSYFTHGPDPKGVDVTFYRPHVYKYRPTTRPGPEDVNWPIYRYADVLLLYAEAQNELGHPDLAAGAVNQLRARARNGTGSENRSTPADISTGLSQAAMRTAILDERRIELAFEGDRWFDQVREGFDYFKNSMLANDTTAVAANLSPAKMLWPIPQSQIDLNPALVQNPGYAGTE